MIFRSTFSYLMWQSRLAVKGAALFAGTVIAQTAILAASYRTPAAAKGPTRGEVTWERDQDHQAYSGQRDRKVFVVGDSLVTGVGCEEATMGPVLPKRLSEALASQLQGRVSYEAVGKTGATVAEIRKGCLSTLREYVEGGGKVDLVVFFCGVNDFKRLAAPWRGSASAKAFRRELEETAEEIRGIVGPSCLIVFPQLPIEAVDRFWGPLGVAVRYIARTFDEQKRAVAEAHGGPAFFIEKPRLRGAPRWTSIDGVHPNDLGYSAWGEHIACLLSPRLSFRHPRGQAAS